MKVAEVIEIVERLAPPSLAREGDSIGLAVGSLEEEVKGILLSLDPTLMAMKKAVELGANLVITHHPLIFRPLKNLTDASPALLFAVKNDLSVYSAHTNLDVAEGGINDVLSQIIGLKSVEKLDVPGIKEEERMGRVGYLEEKISVEELANLLQEKLGTKVRVLGDPHKTVKKVAFCGGGGASLLKEAYRVEADVFITGDINHHAALLALELNQVVIDATHLATERVILNPLKEYLLRELLKFGEEIPIEIYSEEIPWWEVD